MQLISAWYRSDVADALLSLDVNGSLRLVHTELRQRAKETVVAVAVTIGHRNPIDDDTFAIVFATGLHVNTSIETNVTHF